MEEAAKSHKAAIHSGQEELKSRMEEAEKSHKAAISGQEELKSRMEEAEERHKSGFANIRADLAEALHLAFSVENRTEPL